MAESSSAVPSSAAYDVFLNHRGPDAKKTIASHLYRRLLSYGLRVFLDQSELNQGDYFIPQIEDAIRSASVHVAIFSVGYVDSIWCINELVQMLDSKAPIIPVFYHVKPTDLRRTQGKYAEALEKHKRKKDKYNPQTPRYDPSTIENWRNVLSKVADISGFELEACNGDEGELVDKVVERVLKKVKKTALALDVAKYPTGLDDKVKDFRATTGTQSKERRLMASSSKGPLSTEERLKQMEATLANLHQMLQHQLDFLENLHVEAGRRLEQLESDITMTKIGFVEELDKLNQELKSPQQGFDERMEELEAKMAQLNSNWNKEEQK